MTYCLKWIRNTGSSPQRWSGCSTTAHIMFHLHSLMQGFGVSGTIFKAYIQSLKMSYQTCSVDIFVDHQPFGCNLTWKGIFSTRSLFGDWEDVRVYDRPIGSCQLPIDTYGLPLTVLSYLAGSKSVSARLGNRLHPLTCALQLYIWCDF